MDEIKVAVKLGKELTKEELDLINRGRQKIFKTNEVIDPAPDNKNWNSIFFIATTSSVLVSFGMLHSLKLRFQNKDYEVLCFSTVFSLQKGGGKIIMDEMKNYSQKSGRTIIGFCETDLLPFYKKVGWEVLSPQDNQFVYIDESGEIIPNIVPGEVIFNRSKDGVMDEILRSNDKTVKVPLKHYE